MDANQQPRSFAPHNHFDLHHPPNRRNLNGIEEEAQEMERKRLYRDLDDFMELMRDNEADLRAPYPRLYGTLGQIRAKGYQVPTEAEAFERQIEIELISESQGR